MMLIMLYLFIYAFIYLIKKYRRFETKLPDESALPCSLSLIMCLLYLIIYLIRHSDVQRIC